MSKLSQRQTAVLQQMGINPYVVPAAPAELCLINIDQPQLSHPIIEDVLRLLNIAAEQCVVCDSADGIKAKRYWQLKHDMPSRTGYLFSASLSELADPAAKRKLWQRLQAWL